MKEILQSSHKPDDSALEVSVLVVLRNSNSVPWFLQNYEGIYVKGTALSLMKFLYLIVNEGKWKIPKIKHIVASVEKWRNLKFVHKISYKFSHHLCLDGCCQIVWRSFFLTRNVMYWWWISLSHVCRINFSSYLFFYTCSCNVLNFNSIRYISLFHNGTSVILCSLLPSTCD